MCSDVSRMINTNTGIVPKFLSVSTDVCSGLSVIVSTGIVPSF